MRALSYPESKDYFKWSATRFDAMIAIIEADFVGVYEAQNLTMNGTMVVDTVWNVATHKPSSRYFDEDSATEGELFTFIENEKSERGAMFLQEMKEAEPLLYLVSYVGTDARSDAVRLRKIITDKGANDQSLVVLVQEEDRAEDPWREAGIENRYAGMFAPFDDAVSLDVERWRPILQSYDTVR
jgi:hypothetical protein